LAQGPLDYTLVKDFRKWLAAVKSLDDEKRFERDQAIKAFEQSAAASRASSRDANTQNALSGPSRKANAAATTSTTTAIPAPKADYPPKLTEDEKRLLLKYDGCLKCRKPFVYHKGSDKAPGCSFPVGAGYKPLTQAAVMAAMPAGYKPVIASVIPSSSSIHPVAAVFPGIANPVDYLATNASSILGDGDPDSSVSTYHHAVAAIIESINAPALSVPVSSDDTAAPISVPHLFWRASAAVPNDFPAKFDCLIDNGSHLVLIRKAESVVVWAGDGR
jgi:hypothetical protein